MLFLSLHLMRWRSPQREYRVFLKLQGNTYLESNHVVHMTSLEVSTVDLIRSELSQLTNLPPKQHGRPMRAKAKYSDHCKPYNIV